MGGVVMKVSEYIVKKLAQKSINTYFGYVGGFNSDIVDAIFLDQRSQFVVNYHEQASSFAANSYSILSETTSVAIASGAPSACNLLPGIANAYFDSNACLFIVGSVNSKAVKKSAQIRQNAFEEIDFISMCSGISKYATKLSSAEQIRYVLEKALYLAEEGRKGPVVIDIPYDIARQQVDEALLKEFTPTPPPKKKEINIKFVLSKLEEASKPLVLVGGGARSERTRFNILKFLDKVQVPVVASLCGLDVIPHDHPSYLGFIGHYGNRYANLAISNCDSLLILGSRLDERQLAGDVAAFAPSASVLRVDVDEEELNRVLPSSYKFCCSVEEFLEDLNQSNLSNLSYTKWVETLLIWKERYSTFTDGINGIHPNNFFSKLSAILPSDCIICSDVGQTQMCVAQSLQLDKQRRIINSAGYGSMGFSLPAAIGAAYASKGKRIISISGDGGIQMNIQELQTIVREQLPITIFVINNRCLGMIRRLQERLFDERSFASVDGYNAPDFNKIAVAYGLPYFKVESMAHLGDLKVFLDQKTPQFVEVITEQKFKNVPEPGAAINLQTPLLSDAEYCQISREVRAING